MTALGGWIPPELAEGRRERGIRFDGEGWDRSRSGLLLPPTTSARWKYGERPIAIDLFAGCGGFSLGFIQAGFRVVAALEWDSAASITYTHNLATYPMEWHFITPADRERLETYLEKNYELPEACWPGTHNKAAKKRLKGRQKKAKLGVMPLAGHAWIKETDHPGVPHFFFGDASKISGNEILDALELKPGEVDAVMGGPPCQGFSTAGKREVMDPRNSLVFEFARIVTEIQPKTFVMENVPAMATMKTPQGTLVLDELARIFEDAGGWGRREAIRNMLLATSGAGVAYGDSPRGRRAGRSTSPTKATKTTPPKTPAVMPGQLAMEFAL